MILDCKNIEEFGKTFEFCTIRTKVWLKCDYCGTEFQRDKKSISKLNSIVDKDSCGSKECTNSKKEEVNLKRYGSRHLFTSEEFKKETSNKNLKKYGSEYYCSSDDFKQKRNKSMLEKYGVEQPIQNIEIKNKQRETCNKLYGHHNPAQAKSLIDKRSRQNQIKYGVSSPMQLEDIKKKRVNTCISKYGVENFTQTDEYKKKLKRTSLKKYDVNHPLESKSIRSKIKSTILDRYGCEYYAQTEESKKRYANTCLDKYGVPNPLCLPQNRKFGKTQNEIKDELNKLGFNFNSDYKVLNGKEIDLLDSDVRLGIEYCGLYWHTELSPQPRNKDFHYSKYLTCKDAGITLLTIFEDEWKSKRDIVLSIIKSKIKPDTKIQARKCELVELPVSIAKDFYNKHHLQGSSRHIKAAFGLSYKGELVGASSIGLHHRFKDRITLDRFCFKLNTQVVGGAGRLWSACKKWMVDNAFERVITWSDNRWSNGSLYKKLGFTLEEEIKPDYSYVNLAKPYYRLSKQSQKKSNTNCPTNKTEREWAAENGLARIWDCGKKRWAFEIK